MAELSPERRILLAFVLSFIVLIGWGSYMRSKYGPPPGEPAEEPAAAQPAAAEEPAAPPPAPAPPEAEPGPAAVTAEQVQAAEERTVTVETDKATIVFTNRGARVQRWTLKDYEDEAGKPLDLVQGERTGLGLPFALALDDQQAQDALNSARFVVAPDRTFLEAPGELAFEWSDGGLAAHKRFRFEGGYLAEVETRVTRHGEPVAHRVAWRGGFGDPAAVTSQFQVQLLLRTPDDLLRHNAAQATEATGWFFWSSEPPFPYAGPAAYAGIEDRYFAAVFFPEGGALRGTASVDRWTPPGEDGEEDAEEGEAQAVGSVALGTPAPGTNRFRLFVGPKALDILEPLGPRLGLPNLDDELVDFGFFWWVAKPLFLVMKWMYEWIPNYGWVIVVVTILINAVLFPLKWKSMQSSYKMQKLAPQIRAIQNRYKQYKFNDPRKQQMQQEIMGLYKQHGVNPVGGCLPMLLLLPFFYGFYVVLYYSIEMRHAPWTLWIQDLSQPDPYYVLPILMGLTMYISTRMTPMSTPDPTQQRIMQLLPLFLTFLFIHVSSGLVLYWTVSSVVGGAQQWWINRRNRERAEAEKLAAKEERKKKKKRRKHEAAETQGS